MNEQRHNPYVGPRAFHPDETLYGRDRETRDLLNLLIAERVVLLYSPSGAGKTSLINAALVPRLESKDFHVLPTIRVNAEIPSELATSQVHVNRFVLSMMMSLEEDEDLPNEQRILPHELAQMSVSTYLHANRQRRISSGSPLKTKEGLGFAPRGDDPIQDEVFIFDQFEEIITTDPVNMADREEFFDQLGEALFDRRRWALFTMREDYIAMLDPYARYLPTHLQNTFRLDLLDHEAAHAAMQEPARQANFVFTDKAASKLANDLSYVYVRGANGDLRAKPGPYIEPVQLQVVCYRLWKPGIKAIRAEDVTPKKDVTAAGNVDEVGYVDEVLADYYDECVAESAGAGSISERAIRDWFDHELITQNIRGRVMAGSKQCSELTEPAIQRLIDTHIIRQEVLRGATWYELSHDRLIKPVQQRNAKWRAENLSPLQRQAELWAQQGRSDGLLLRGTALTDAEQWAKDPAAQLNADEQDFLTACLKARVAEQHERRRNQWIRALAVVALIGLALAVVGGLYAVQQARIAEAANVEAQKQRDAAQSRQLAGQAIASLDSKPDLALLLSLEALDVADTAEARNSLLTGLQSSHYMSATLRGQRFSVSDMAVSSDSRLLAAAGNNEIILWDLNTGTPLTSPLVLNNEWISSLAFNANGKILAAGGCARQDGESNCAQGDIQLWDVSEPDFPVRLGIPLTDHADTVWSVAFSPDGKLLATGSRDQTIRLWDVSNPQAPVPEGVPLLHPEWVSSMAFSPDGRTLASNGCGDFDPTSGLCKVVLWNVSDPQKPLSTTLTGGIDWVMKVAFSSDGKRLAAAGYNGAVILWDTQTGDQLSPALKSEGPFVQSIAFSPDGTTLAASSKNEGITVWDLSNEPYEPESIAGGNFNSVVFVSDSILAAGNADNGAVTLWDRNAHESPALLASSQSLEGQSIKTLTFDANVGQMALSAGDDLVYYYDRETDDGWSDSVGGATVKSLAFSNDRSMLGAGDEGGAIKIWNDLKTKRVIAELNEHTGPVTGLAFSPHDNLLVSSGDSRVITWDISDQQKVRKTGVYTFPGQSEVTSVIFDSSGTQLAVGSADTSIVLLEVLPTGDLRQLGLPLTSDHTSPVKSLAFSPDDKWLASGDEDGKIILWDVAKSPPIGHPLLGTQDDEVASLLFSPDGEVLVSSGCGQQYRSDCHTGSIRLWDVQSRQALGESFDLHTNRVNDVAFLQVEGAVFLASGGEDGLFGLWNLNRSAWKERACQLAGRNLRRDEWEQYLPDKEYHAICPETALRLYETVEQADAFALARHTSETAPDAAAAFSEALQTALQTNSALLNNDVCWTGSIDGFAQLVLPACKRAVQLAPEDSTNYYMIRDSRGLAYAITGDYVHAIEDFKAYVEWAGNRKGLAASAQKREAWIKVLEKCVNESDKCDNPFSDPRTLQSYRND